jgi:hypothetical protein
MSNVTETPTPTNHEAAAQGGLAAIRGVMEAIPGYGHSGRAHRRRIRMIAALSDKFLNAVASALDASERLRVAAGVTGAQLRDAISHTNAYRPFADSVDVMTNGARQAVESSRSDAGALALKAYRIAGGMNSPGDLELLIPHLHTMKEALGRGRPKTSATPPAPLPAPAPSPVPAPSPAPSPAPAPVLVKEGGTNA